MCEQCIALTEVLCDSLFGQGEIALVRATRDGSYMKEKEYGLVLINDPFLTFSIDPWPDPAYGLSDEEMDTLSEEEWEQVDKWAEDAFDFRIQIRTPPPVPSVEEAWKLLEMAKGSGYIPSGGFAGGGFEMWLFHHLGMSLANRDG